MFHPLCPLWSYIFILLKVLKICVNGFSQTQGTLQTGSIFATFGCLKCGIHAFLGTDSGKNWKLHGCVCVCLNLFGFPNFKQLLSHVLPVLQQGTQQKRVSSLSLTWVSSCFFIYSLKHTFSVIYPINKNERHQYWTKLSQLFPKTMERTCLSILVEQVPSEIVAKKCRTCF